MVRQKGHATATTPAPVAAASAVRLSQTFVPIRKDITAAELRACAESWYGAQQEYAPLPEVGGYVEAGFSLRGGVVRSADAPEGERPGAALIFIRGPDEEPVLTMGGVRQPSDGAFVWRFLYERAEVRPKPLEHPRAPWVAYRHEPAAEEHAAMLPVLGEVARMLAWTWLRAAPAADPDRRRPTTSATIQACSLALLTAGAKQVYAMTLARAVLGDDLPPNPQDMVEDSQPVQSLY